MSNNLFPSFPPSIPNFQPIGPTSLVSGSQYVQIPNLQIVIGLDGTEQLETVQYGQSKRVTTDQIRTYIFDNIPVIPTLIVNNLIALDSIADKALLPTGVVWVDNDNIFTTSSNFTFASNILNVPQVVSSFTGPIGNFTPNTGIFTNVTANYVNIINPSAAGPGIAKVMDLSFMGAPGAISVNVPLSLIGPYNLNLPIDSGILGHPLLSGGGGTNPMFYGNISGNTTTFGTTLGSFVAGQLLTTDTSGNIIDSGMVPAGVNPGLMNQLAWYETTGSVVSGLPTANDGVLVTDPSGAPSISSTLPIQVQQNITQVGTITIGSWQASIIDVPFGGTGLSSGISGGILYFNSITSLASSGVLSINDPILGGGIAGSPFSGSRLGNTTQFATTSGTFTAGNALTTDVNGNLIDTGAPSSGTVDPGLINEVAWYAATGSTVSGLVTANDGVLVTSNTGVPSIGSILPLAVQGNITELGTITLGMWQASLITVPFGGTGLSSGTSGGILYFDSNTSLLSTAVLSLDNPILGGGPGGAPFSGARSGSTTIFGTTSGTFTAGNSLTTDSNHNIIDSGTPVFSGSVNPGLINELSWYASTGSAVSGLTTANNGVLITSNTGVPSIGSTLPVPVQVNITNLGVVTSGTWNAGIIPVPFGGTGDSSFTSNGVIYGNGTGGLQVTAQGAANSVLIANAGAPSFSSNPTVRSLNLAGSTSGIVGLIPPASFTSYNFMFPLTQGIAGQPLLSGGGAAQTYGTLQVPGGGTGNTTLTLNGVLYGNGTSAIQSTAQGGPNTVLASNSGAPLFTSSPTIGQLNLAGVTSGVISIIPQAVAGTYNFNLPITPGTAGQVLTSGGGGVAAMTWTNTGTGTVNPGTLNQMAWYSATGSAISGLPTANNGVLITSNTGVPSIGSTLPTAVQTNITQLGTITSGVWNGTAIGVPFGGTGGTTFTANGVLYGNGSTSILSTAQGPAFSVLTANAGAPVFSASPVIGNSVTTPQIYGGSTSSSQLLLASTSSGVTSSDKVSIAAGSVIKLTVDGGGVFVNKGSPGSTASSLLQIGPGNATPGNSQLKFSQTTALLSTPESGAIEYFGNSLYLTNNGIRRTVLDGSMAAIPATTLTTTSTVFAAVSIFSGENYIVDISIPFSSSANSVVIGFNGTSVAATELSLMMFSNAILTPSVYANVSASGGVNTTAPANMVILRITGMITAGATGTFSMHLATNINTVPLLAGGYYKYTQF
jgi:hypothetical protein